MIADRRPDVEDDRGCPRDTRLGARGEHFVQMLVVIGETGKDRGDEDARPDARLREPAEDLKPLPAGRGSRLDNASHVLVQRVHAHGDGQRGGLVQSAEDVEIAHDEGRLGEDRERVCEVGERFDHPTGQLVAPLAVLIGIGGGAHRHRLAVPAGGRELAAQHLDHVRLYDDLRREVVADPQIQVAVKGAGEAVVAAMRAPAVWVHSPAEGDPAQLRHTVQSRLAEVF